ncbi:uncharacterized protein LOC144429750 [Styela clava]
METKESSKERTRIPSALPEKKNSNLEIPIPDSSTMENIENKIELEDIKVTEKKNTAVSPETESPFDGQEIALSGGVIETLQIVKQTNIEEFASTHVVADHGNIETVEAIVSAESANVAAEEVALTAKEAVINAENLHQTNINETNFVDAEINNMAVQNLNIHIHPAPVPAPAASLQSDDFIEADSCPFDFTSATERQKTTVNQVTPSSKQQTAFRQEPGLLERMISCFGARNHVSTFIKVINERSKKISVNYVTESFKQQKLTEPEFQVNPRIKELTQFYIGEMVPKQKEYRKEIGFCAAENNSDGSFITLDQLIKSFQNRQNRHVVIVGQAGSGKTTMIKRLIRQVIDENVLCEDMYTQYKKRKLVKQFYLVHFVNVRDIKNIDCITARQLLFDKIVSDLTKEKTKKFGYNWIVENQEKVIFFFDGLDQATWSLFGEYDKIQHGEAASTATVVSNIIGGHLFPRVQIVVSSREHCIAPLPKQLRPNLIYSLAGLNPNDVKKLYIAFLGDEGENQWDKMCSNAPALIPLCSVPVFLVFNAIVQSLHPEESQDTMTGVMLQILWIFVNSDHNCNVGTTKRQRKRNQKKVQNAPVREEKLTKIHSLKQLAFKGMKEKRVVFTSDELERAGINLKNIGDFVIKVPGKAFIVQSLFDGNFSFFFSHQTIQEVLAALFLCEMNLAEFETFVKTSMHNDHWSVVLRFTCGILLNECLKVDEFIGLFRIGDKEEKRKILKHSLNERVRHVKTEEGLLGLMELFGVLYESGDVDMIRSHIQEIDFENAEINPSGMLAISSVMRRCGNLNLARFAECGLNSELLGVMATSFRDSQLMVSKFEIIQLEQALDGLRHLGSILKYCHPEEVFFKCSCEGLELKDMANNFQEGKIRKFTFEPAKSMDGSLFAGISGFIEKFVEEAEIDSLDECYANDVASLGEGYGCKRMVIHKVTMNKMTADLGRQLGKTCALYDVREVEIKDIILHAGHMSRVVEHIGQCMLKKLVLTNLIERSSDLFVVLSKFVESHVDEIQCDSFTFEHDDIGNIITNGVACKKLVINSARMRYRKISRDRCNQLALLCVRYVVKEIFLHQVGLEAQHLKSFLENIGDAKFEALEIGDSFKLKKDGFTQIGRIIKTCGVKRIKIKESDLKAVDIRAVRENLGDSKLSLIDVSRNALGVEEFNELGSIVTQCDIEEIIVKECGVNKENIQAFKDNLGDVKIKSFDLTSNDVELMGVKGLALLGEIVRECEVESLIMKKCKFSEDQLEKFKSLIGDSDFVYE